MQPLFGRLVLPLLGGAPAVWTICMLFFQAALLSGYALVHVTRRLPFIYQTIAYASLALLSFTMLPIDVSSHAASGHRPIAWLLQTLILSIGAPFLVLATTAPLLQRWFTGTGHTSADDPYFLYATSNAGSLLALVAYPAAIEPLLSLGTQTRAWSFGYLIAMGLVLACAAFVRRLWEGDSPGSQSTDRNRADAPTTQQRAEWLALALVPSSLLLAVTTYLSTDVAAVPLLWIVPLTIYLLAFVIAFSSRRDVAVSIAGRALPLVLLPIVLFMVARGGAARWFVVPLNLALLATMTMLCVGRLAAARPPAAYLTEFYLWLAAGGMLGGIFNAIVAPALFTGVAEYPIVIAAGCLLLASGSGLRATLRDPRALARPVLVGMLALAALQISRDRELDPRLVQVLLAAPALLCLNMSRQPPRFGFAVAFLLTAGWMAGTDAWGRVVYAERTFFGVYRVGEDKTGKFRTLYHGTTVHGRQAIAGPVDPLTYYHRGSPIADVLRSLDRTPRSVGVVGLGVGSLAAYARPGDRWTFYEIDPAVERIARNAQLFGFLPSCSSCTVVVGDARTSLASTGAAHDLLVLDAFSSDAIPIHLLTREALGLYLSRLAPDGLIAFHISNRHVELRPVVARLARDVHWSVAARFDPIPAAASPTAGEQHGRSSSDWAVMARDAAQLATILDDRGWSALSPDDRPAWSDDFSNLWTSLRWK